jgi:hypothetical protein
MIELRCGRGIQSSLEAGVRVSQCCRPWLRIMNLPLVWEIVEQHLGALIAAVEAELEGSAGSGQL